MRNDRDRGMQKLEDYIFKEATHFWKSLDVCDLNLRIWQVQKLPPPHISFPEISSCSAMLWRAKTKTTQTVPKELVSNTLFRNHRDQARPHCGHFSCKLGSPWRGGQKDFIPYFQYYKMQAASRFQGPLPGCRSTKRRENQLQTTSNRKEERGA